MKLEIGSIVRYYFNGGVDFGIVTSFKRKNPVVLSITGRSSTHHEVRLSNVIAEGSVTEIPFSYNRYSIPETWELKLSLFAVNAPPPKLVTRKDIEDKFGDNINILL